MPDRLKFRRLLNKSPLLFLLNDEFSDTRAAGAVNGTPAVPGPGTRTVVDTNGKLSLAGGAASFAAGGAVSDPAIWLDAVGRVAGNLLVGEITPVDGTYSTAGIGFDNDVSTTIRDSIRFAGSNSLSSLVAGATLVLGLYESNKSYKVALVMRASGTMFFIKGGAFENWTLLYLSITSSGVGYPAVNALGIQSVFTCDFLRVPTQLWTSIPVIASDSFNRTNGAIGSTDGAGLPEGGGAGLAWANQVGTWAIATNKAAGTTAGGLAIATITGSTQSVMASITPTRSAGSLGLVFWYTDASNYARMIWNGTNLQLYKTVGGSESKLVDAAASNGVMIVSTNGTAIRCYMNNALIGAEQTIADLTPSNLVGLYSDNNSNMFDNFVIMPKGNEGQYSYLDQFTK